MCTRIVLGPLGRRSIPTSRNFWQIKQDEELARKGGASGTRKGGASGTYLDPIRA